MFLGLSTAAVLQDEYWGGLQSPLTKHGVGGWQVPTVVSGSVNDLFLLFSDNVTVHFHVLRVSCKMLLH